MNMKSISIVCGAILLALAPSAFAKAMRVTPTNLIASSQARADPVHHRRHGYCGWIPHGTIAGPTGGYPYYGWYGYPYAPYRRCGHPHYRFER